MATVKGPLFSIGASGTVAGAVVYSTWKGRPYVRQHAVPANPNSVLQVSVRSMLRFLSQQWTNLSAGQIADWDTRAAVTNISPFNAYVAYNMERWGRYKAPSKLDPATEDDDHGVFWSFSGAAAVKSIVFTYKLSNDQENWGLIIYQSLTPVFTPGRDNVVRVLRLEDTDEATYTLTGLTTGTDYYYNSAFFSDAGLLGAANGEVGPYTPT